MRKRGQKPATHAEEEDTRQPQDRKRAFFCWFLVCLVTGDTAISIGRYEHAASRVLASTALMSLYCLICLLVYLAFFSRLFCDSAMAGIPPPSGLPGIGLEYNGV
jgi:hypothetical protein